MLPGCPCKSFWVCLGGRPTAPEAMDLSYSVFAKPFRWFKRGRVLYGWKWFAWSVVSFGAQMTRHLCFQYWYPVCAPNTKLASSNYLWHAPSTHPISQFRSKIETEKQLVNETLQLLQTLQIATFFHTSESPPEKLWVLNMFHIFPMKTVIFMGINPSLGKSKYFTNLKQGFLLGIVTPILIIIPVRSQWAISLLVFSFTTSSSWGRQELTWYNLGY